MLVYQDMDFSIFTQLHKKLFWLLVTGNPIYRYTTKDGKSSPEPVIRTCKYAIN